MTPPTDPITATTSQPTPIPERPTLYAVAYLDRRGDQWRVVVGTDMTPRTNLSAWPPGSTIPGSAAPVEKPAPAREELDDYRPYTIPCPQEDDPYMVIGPGVSEECDDYDHADHLCQLLNRAAREGRSRWPAAESKAMSTIKKSTPVPQWCPYLRYTWTRAQLRAWIDANGASAFYDRQLWSVQSRHIGVGRYEVTFTESK